MKKTISINISGVIFHIEEDGYEKLKQYLTSIQQYFSTYEDSQEIVTDIENRIAEKLLATLKGDEKTPARQAVTLEDVNGLIARMGTVADFEAVEKEEILVAGGTRQKAATGNVPASGQPAFSSTGSQSERQQTTTENPTRPRDRKLTRDTRRKTLGGVASGLAHYFQIDPVWVRVLLISAVIGFPVIGDGMGDGNGLFSSLGGFTVIAYILLWIILPGSNDLQEEKGIKKFYRNPDNKVLGGVASGLAAYFGVDTSVIRIALVFSVFVFGFGVLAYIVLWMVAPEARSVTEKMEMIGKPITLSNIESSVKSNLNVAPTAPESGLTQLLLFPFRAIAAIFGALGQLFGKTLGGLGTVIRVLFGLLLLLIGFSFTIACLTVFGAGLGILAGTNFGPGDGIPMSILREDISILTLIAGFVVGILPSVAIMLTGLLVITRRSLISGNTVLTLFGAWVISGVILATTIPQVVGEFRKYGRVETTTIVTPAGMPTFTMNERYNDGEFNIRPHIELEGYNGTDIKVVMTASARGRTRDDAQANARQIRYKPVVKDSTVDFAEEFDLPENARFRDQELRVTVYVPFNKPFRMTEDFGRFIDNRFDDTELEGMPNNLWQFTTNGLIGVGFERTYDRDDTDTNDNDDRLNDDDVEVSTDGPQTKALEVGTVAPKVVSVSGNFGVRFQKGTQFKVVADGEGWMLDQTTATNEDGTLRVENRNNNDRRVGLTVTLPSLETIRLSGSSNARLTEFDSFTALTVDLSGSSELLLKATVGSLTTDQTGATKLILRGKADQMQATLSGASRLNATQMRLKKADVNTSGAAAVRLSEVANLTQKANGTSRIERETGK
ncbi:hypothetical protein FAES_3808 [Fibrella aestuarina BUZ 2]|uniref:Phage shock protein C, PspC n=1 Tax=Fibrella aestuarina BUZ 2 TaxID=1166018 RepID=I0KCG2_9BACT|nr:PspC domain-containing protein [Fibrella aestuarina]CCH01815.1 hypothetical protein FAES_3808 [Fibrella aestuarina BUZ 2]